MSLSEYEQKQFELLTAGLNFADSVALKEMEKRDKVTAKGVNPRSRLSKAWTSALIWFGLAIIAAAYVYVELGSILDAFLILVFVGVFMMATEYAGNPRRNSRNHS